jgi:hypothetical protein
MSMPIEYERNRSDVLGAVIKLMICETKLNVSEMYFNIYWRKNHVNCTLCAGNYWEPFGFERRIVCVRACARARVCVRVCVCMCVCVGVCV